MEEPEDTDSDHRTTAQPRSLRVIGWLMLILGALSLPDELNRILDGRSVRWVYTLLALVSVAGPVGLLLRRRWGYLVTLGYWLSGIVWGGWLLYFQDDYAAARPFGVLLLLIFAIPVAFLLTPKARRWFKDVSRPGRRHRPTA
jgi:hypothetical protein